MFIEGRNAKFHPYVKYSSNIIDVPVVKKSQLRQMVE
jgi:hypothetical protein